MSLTRIGSIGINTGIAFAGVTTIVTLNTSNDALSIGATVNVGSGITLGASGDIFFTGIATGNGSGLTALNASNLGSGTVPTARLGSGTASSSTFLRGDSTFATVTSTTINNNADNRLITGSGTANTLEAESSLTFDGTNLDLGADNKKLRLGGGNDIELYTDGSHSYLNNENGNWYIHGSTGSNSQEILIRPKQAENSIRAIADGAVELYHDNSKRLETTSAGVKLLGSGTDAIEITGDVWFNNNEHAGADIYFNSGDKRLIYEDNVKAVFGGGGDLQIVHNGSDSQITDSGTGSLALGGSAVFIQNAAHDANMASFVAGAEANLFHNGTNYLSTSSSGVDVKVTSSDTSHPPDKYLLIYNSNNSASTMAGIRFVATSSASNDHYIFQQRHSAGGGADLVVTQNTNERVRFIESGGICFNGDSAAANALDDYEEGTFTLTCTSGGFSSVSGTGTYTKIGRCVIFQGDFSLIGSGNADVLRLDGLPFVSNSWAAISGYTQNYGNEGSQQLSWAVRGSTNDISGVEYGNEASGNAFSAGYLNVAGCFQT